MAFTTTLIIGLGGIGSRVVEGIYKKFMASNPPEVDRRNVAFLCMDTDENDIKERRLVMPADSIVKTSSDLSCTIGGYIDRIKDNSTVLDWFDTKSPHLLSLAINEGAAQVRMASRLASISAISEGKFAAIDNCITNLLTTEPERHTGNNIKIHIVCSLAGGTGAGSFLQTAYYVKNAMREHNASAPKITGYFLLADVLCCDSNIGLSEEQKENVRSNTYACVKELEAFSGGDSSFKLSNITFEYRRGQRDKRLPVDPPYDTCFITDYFGVDGGNLVKKSRYEEQAKEFIYLNAFDPIGDNFRSNAINDIRQKIDLGGEGRYASFGVSKLVYPVDDLIAYFSCQRVVDNLSGTWLRIDKDFEERLVEYKKNIDQGVRSTEPSRGKHFMQQVEALGTTGSGREGVEFRRILQSTKLNTEGNEVGGKSKARAYLESVEAYVDKLIQSSEELKGLYETCTVANPNFTKNTGFDNDMGFVTRRERELNDYLKAVLSYIDSNKSVAIKQCFVIDHDNEGFVSKNPMTDTNHLNTYILEKENEMHPLAVRYMLYEVQSLLEQYLKKKKAENKKLGDKITEKYKLLFDNPETKDRVEDARESLNEAHGKAGGVINRVKGFVSGKNTYKAAKLNYETKSRQQAFDIRKYLKEKLLEETYSGLLMQINLLIEEEETFFKSLPNAIFEVSSTLNTLLKKHDANNDPCVSYVLSSEQIKKDIYNDVISRSDSPFFPPEMSAALYRSMFDNAVEALNMTGYSSSKKKDKKKEMAKRAAENKKIVENCIVFQEQLIREKNRNYSEMNVIAALREESMRETDNDPEAAREYMLQKFHNFRDRAEIWGPSNIDNVRHINAWGIHPDCLEPDTITQREIDELFGDTNVQTNPKTAATRIQSERFSPFEVIRVNAVTLLTVSANYKSFFFKEKTLLSDESFGSYYVAYRDVVDRVSRRNSKTYSPHLDKHWHLPAYMPNIGCSYSDEVIKVFRALCWGMLMDKFKIGSKGGDNYWRYVGEISCYIKDVDDNLILPGNSLKYALDRLFQALIVNPEMVNNVLKDADKLWQNAKDEWLKKETDGNSDLDSMKNAKIVKIIHDFRFDFFVRPQQTKKDNWLSVLTSKENLLLDRLLNADGGKLKIEFIKELAERILWVFGPSTNTRKLCEYILNLADNNSKGLANALLKDMDEHNRFQPVD